MDLIDFTTRFHTSVIERNDVEVTGMLENSGKLEKVLCQAILDVRYRNFNRAIFQLDQLENLSDNERIAVDFIYAECYTEMANLRMSTLYFNRIRKIEVGKSFRIYLLMSKYYLLKNELQEIPDCLSLLFSVVQNSTSGQYIEVKYIELMYQCDLGNRKVALSIVKQIESAVYDRLIKNDPQVLPITISIFDCLLSNDKYKEGFKIIKEAEALARRKISEGFDESLLFGIHGGLGAFEFVHNGNYSKALEYFEAETDLEERNKLNFSPNYIVALHNQASCWHRLGDSACCLAINLRALEHAEQSFDANSHEVLKTLNGLALAYLRYGELNNALNTFRRCAEKIDILYSKDAPEVTMYLNNLGGVFSKMNLHEAALKYYHRAYKIELEARGENKAAMLYLRNYTSVKKKIIGSSDEIIRDLKKVLKVYSSIMVSDHSEVIEIMEQLSEVLYDAGYDDEAEVVRNEMYRFINQRN